MPQKSPNPKHKSQNRAGLLRHLNTREVLAMLLKHGGLSRADLTRLTGISGPTITRTVQDLLDAKLVEEGEPSKAMLGRPGKMIHLATAKAGVMALVIGQDACEISASGLDGKLQRMSWFQIRFSWPAINDTSCKHSCMLSAAIHG